MARSVFGMPIDPNRGNSEIIRIIGPARPIIKPPVSAAIRQLTRCNLLAAYLMLLSFCGNEVCDARSAAIHHQVNATGEKRPAHFPSSASALAMYGMQRPIIPCQ